MIQNGSHSSRRGRAHSDCWPQNKCLLNALADSESLSEGKQTHSFWGHIHVQLIQQKTLSTVGLQIRAYTEYTVTKLIDFVNGHRDGLSLHGVPGMDRRRRRRHHRHPPLLSTKRPFTASHFHQLWTRTLALSICIDSVYDIVHPLTQSREHSVSRPLCPRPAD